MFTVVDNLLSYLNKKACANFWLVLYLKQASSLSFLRWINLKHYGVIWKMLIIMWSIYMSLISSIIQQASFSFPPSYPLNFSCGFIQMQDGYCMVALKVHTAALFALLWLMCLLAAVLLITGVRKPAKPRLKTKLSLPSTFISFRN